MRPNVTALLKPYKPKSKPEPWLNSEIRLLRQACRKAKHKWKKDNLHISFQLFKESLLVYQSAVKSAKATYFSNLNMENHSRPKVLFSVINSVVNPPINTMCTTLCESFLRFFIYKISNLRSTISPSHTEPSIPLLHYASWDAFEPVSLHLLKDTIVNTKLCFCSFDTIHPKFFY